MNHLLLDIISVALFIIFLGIGVIDALFLEHQFRFRKENGQIKIIRDFTLWFLIGDVLFILTICLPAIAFLFHKTIASLAIAIPILLTSLLKISVKIDGLRKFKRVLEKERF